MIFGIGCDVCALDHLEKASPAPMPPPLCGGCTARRNAQRWRWTHLPAGHSGAHRLASAAADFAAKEAFLKAAGTGLREPFALREIEAVRLESGAPAYRFSGATARWVADHGLTAHLSLSHDGGMALAFCILETAPET